MKCANCGSETDGRFCSHCGAGQGATVCLKCGHESAAGARFCNQCGAAIVAVGGASNGVGATTAGAPTAGAGSSPGPASQAVWYMAGALMVGLILVVAYPVYGPSRDTPGPASTAPAGASAVDLSSMTPREAADRLFNRVMTAASSGDVAEVTNFLPMAIGAHELVEDLDADGKFHLVLLRLQGSLNDEALSAAEEILADQPQHLLGLAGAADASLALGDSASARAFFQRWLDAFDAERAKNLPEYSDHSGIFPTMRVTAQALIGND